jgi:uncharacterized protein (TIGR02996 family)
MSQERAFLVAIRPAPQDAALRLVYADWLEENGDARADYFRVTTEALSRIQRGLAWDDLVPGLRAACEAAPSEWWEQSGPWFEVVLESFPPEQKITLIHVVQAIATSGLWEAKMLKAGIGNQHVKGSDHQIHAGAPNNSGSSLRSPRREWPCGGSL